MCVIFHNLLILNIQGSLHFLAPRLEGHPLLAVHHSLFNIFLGTLHICRPALHSQHEDVSFCDSRDPLNVVMVTKDAGYCGARDPLNMIMAAEGTCKNVLNLTLMLV